MKINNITKFLLLSLGGCLIFLGSCNKEIQKLVETPKSIEGKWKIASFTRKSEDLTGRMDTSTFRIIFNADKTYTLLGKFPFCVSNSGTYSLDDALYPLYLNLQEKDSITVNKLNLDYPIVNGKRQIRVVISPGCTKNSYGYSFEKIE